MQITELINVVFLRKIPEKTVFLTTSILAEMLFFKIAPIRELYIRLLYFF